MIAPRAAFDSRQPSSVEEVTAAVFEAEGWLQKALRLDYRPQQARMAEGVASAFAERLALLVEAGTGVGKSLAYLVPALIHAEETRRPAIISTHTISLQEQIQRKDLELCRKLFQQAPELIEFARFRTAVLVGRGNYLCTTRLQRALEGKAELFQSTEMTELQRLQAWAKETEHGLLQELNPAPPGEVWEWVSADSSVCNSKNCTADSCFYRKARAAVEGAHLVVVNHSLLCALIAAGAGPKADKPGILLPDDFAVIDEAHTLPDVATDHFGNRLSAIGLDRLLKQLFNPNKQRGILRKLGHRKDQMAVVEAMSAAEEFFNFIRYELLQARDPRRIIQPNWTAPVLETPLRVLEQRLHDLQENSEQEATRLELRDLRNRVGHARITAADAIDLGSEGHVYWAESSGRSGKNVALRSAPIDISAVLRERFFRRRTSVILTSATLDGDPRLDSFAQRVGAENEIRQRETSPFDYDLQMEVWLADWSPDMESRNPQQRIAPEFFAAEIDRWASDSPGGTLVLFTAYTDLRATAQLLRPSWEKQGRKLFAQGEDGPRTTLTRAFAEAGNALLLGTESFWTGVDLPGSALSQVIVARLPFANPSQPVAEARHDAIRAVGGNPFREITLPEAVLKFRQGIGRLIRSQTDSGRIVVLDSRILRKPYGQNFVDALPTISYKRYTPERE